jgi:PKD repeat protein
MWYISTPKSLNLYILGKIKTTFMTHFYQFFKLNAPIVVWLLIISVSPVFAQLNAGTTYPINGTQNPPTSFSTVANAFTYLNANGTAGTGNVILEIQSGYTGETGVIPALTAYPGMSSTRPVTLRPGSGMSPTISTSPAANSSVIRLNGTQYFTIDGSNNGSSSQNLMITTTSTTTTVTLVSLVPTATSACTNITVKNCVLLGASTTTAIYTYAGIYLGSGTATPGAALSGGNNNNTFRNNYIQAVLNGIFLRGTNVASTMDQNNLVEFNTVGGTVAPNGGSPTTFFGGVSTLTNGGIYMNSQNLAIIRNNIIRNSHFNFYYARGIHLDALAAASAGNTNVLIEKNSISDIRYTGTSGYGVNGIRVQTNNNTGSNITIQNNYLWNIASDGDNISSLYDYALVGIAITSNAGSANTNVGVNIYHNSVNMYDNGVNKLSSIYTGATVANVALQANVAGGVKMIGNILKNTYPGVSTANRSFNVFVQNTTNNPFTAANNGRSNFNNFYLLSAVATNNVGYIVNANRTTLPDWKDLDIDSSTQFVNPPFTSNTNLKIPANTTTVLESGSMLLPNLTDDIEGDIRAGHTGYSQTPAGTVPDIGADEFPGNEPDDISISNLISPVTACGLGNTPVSIVISNVGKIQAIGKKIPVAYVINNGTPVRDTITLSTALGKNGNLTYTFPANANLSSFSVLSFKVYVGLSNDNNRLNDSISTIIQNFSCISSATYREDFENGTGNWTDNGLWQWGSPTKAVINSAASGSNIWVTNLTGLYPNSANNSLISPPFDMTKACGSTLSFKMWLKTEAGWDAIIMETTTDNINWSKHFAVTPAYDNTSANGPIPPNKWSGNNNGWMTYNADFSAYAGAPFFRYRFRFGSDPSINDDGVGIDSINFILYPVLGTASFSGNDTAFINSPIRYISNVAPDNGITYQWFLNGTIVSTASFLDRTFTATGSDTIKHVAIACNQRDSSTRVIHTVMPVGRPKANFIANLNLVDQYDNVTFTDLTTNGATGWQWFITPQTGYDWDYQTIVNTFGYATGFTATSRNPVVSFLLPGKYSVCLVAENANGFDTICMQDYIVVRKNANLCTFPNTTAFPFGVLYDNGGRNLGYANGQNCTFLIEPACADEIILTLKQLNTELNADFLAIYDGDMPGGTPLFNSTLYPKGLSGTLAGNQTTFTAKSGKVTVMFNTNGATTAAGFELEWESTPVLDSAMADFGVNDTVCVGATIDFVNQSTGTNNTYLWDLDGDGLDDIFTKEASFIYPVDGPVNVRLIAANCNRIDTIYKTVIVVIPSLKAKPGFTTTQRKVTMDDLVSLTDSTFGCVSSRQWEFSPSTVSFATGFTAASENPVVKFNATGCYTVKLFVTNAAGTDSLVRNCYIEVISICRPNVANLNPDLGISRVKFENIDQSSASGTTSYSDFTNTQSATVESGVTYSITVERNTTINSMSRAVWIDYNHDGDFVDAGELVATEASSKTLSWTSSFMIPNNATIGTTRMRVGVTLGGLGDQPCGNIYGEYEDYRLLIIKDITIPVITLLGIDTVYIEQGNPYVDSGATAFDNVDGVITGNITVIGSVDIWHYGTYQLLYSVSDNSGNAAVTRRRIVIVTPDTTRPVITMLGQTPDTIAIFNSYTDPGATAFDITSGNLTPFIIATSNVDTGVVGFYHIDYSVSDSSGNTATVRRTVYVIDTVKATITLFGADTMYIEVHNTYTEPGAQATGAGGMSLNVTISGSVDTALLGVYTLDYSASDFNGFVYHKVRTVIVGDTTDPTLGLIGPDTIIADVHDPYYDPNITMSDNYWNSTGLTVTVSNNVDIAKLGIYTVTYTVTDGSGNSSTISRVVGVIDRVKPDIGLVGADVIHIKRWDHYVDSGYSLSDNYWPNSSIRVDTLGNFPGTLETGIFYIEYRATDSSGNVAYTTKRIIYVDSLTTAVRPIEFEQGHLIVYPNPSSGNFKISVSMPGAKTMSVSIRNTMGQELRTFSNLQPDKDDVEINLENIAQGVYFVVVQSGDRSMIKRIIINR